MATSENAKYLEGRVIHKHDIEAAWDLCTDFIPQKGEIIVYDIDSKCFHERAKIGDGVTNIKNLPFINNGRTPYATVNAEPTTTWKTVISEILSQTGLSTIDKVPFCCVSLANYYNRSVMIEFRGYTGIASAPNTVDIILYDIQHNISSPLQTIATSETFYNTHNSLQEILMTNDKTSAGAINELYRDLGILSPKVKGKRKFVDRPDLESLSPTPQTLVFENSVGEAYNEIKRAYAGSSYWNIYSLFIGIGGGEGKNAFVNNPSGQYGVADGWHDNTAKTINILEEPENGSIARWIAANTTSLEDEIFYGDGIEGCWLLNEKLDFSELIAENNEYPIIIRVNGHDLKFEKFSLYPYVVGQTTGVIRATLTEGESIDIYSDSTGGWDDSKYMYFDILSTAQAGDAQTLLPLAKFLYKNGKRVEKIVGTWKFNPVLKSSVTNITTQEQYDELQNGEGYYKDILAFSNYNKPTPNINTIYTKFSAVLINGTFEGITYDNEIVVDFCAPYDSLSYDPVARWSNYTNATITFIKEPELDVANWVRENARKLPNKLPRIRFANYMLTEKEGVALPIHTFIVENLGGGELVVGDTLQVCCKRKYCNGKKYKLRKMAEYTIKEGDIGQRFIKLEVLDNESTAKWLFRNNRNGHNTISNIYFRFKRVTSYDAETLVECNAIFSNQEMVQKTYVLGTSTLHIK